MKKRDIGIEAAVLACGSLSALASKVGISPQAICQWREVPPLRVIAVEKASGVPRFLLRPDLYPKEGRA